MKPLSMDFGDNRTYEYDFTNHHKIITDRRSVYSVTIGIVSNRDDISLFLKQVRSLKKYDRATHHTWAVRISHDGSIYESKNDDGETGAGGIVLRMLQKYHMVNTIICVTRWYGGIRLEADRFRHVQDACIYALEYSKPDIL